MLKYLDHLFEKIEGAPMSLAQWTITLICLVLVRLAIENFFIGFTFHFLDFYFYFFTDFFFSFAFTLLLVTPIIRWAGRVTFSQAANMGLFAFCIIWLPPIIDEVLSHGSGLISYYCFDSFFGLISRYLTFFGDDPTVGITYGIRWEIGIVTIFIALYAFIRTKSWWRSCLAALFLYSALFFIASLPSWIAIAFLGFKSGWLTVSEIDIAAFMLKPELLFGLPQPEVASALNLKVSLIFSLLCVGITTFIGYRFFRPMFLAFVNNMRFPQILYHLGLFSLGGSLVFIYGKPAFELNFFHVLGLGVLLLAVIFAWTASVIFNDLADVAIDRLTNPTRPLITNDITPETYHSLGVILFVISLLFSALISTQLMLLLAIYQAIAWLYSAPPLRLKRFPGIATLLAASASMLVFFGGYIVFSLNKNISDLPWSISALLFFAYCTLLPIKDFKDIPGDAKDGVITLPILWGEVKAKRIIGSLAFFCFIVSVFIFDVRHLFPLAFFFGSLAYWLLQMSSATHRYFSYHRLAGWYIALVSSYVAFLAFHFFTR